LRGKKEFATEFTEDTEEEADSIAFLRVLCALCG